MLFGVEDPGEWVFQVKAQLDEHEENRNALETDFSPDSRLPSWIEFERQRYSTLESGSAVRVQAARRGASDRAVSVSIRTEPMTAQPGRDYIPVVKQITWEVGDMSLKDVVVPLAGDDQQADGTKLLRLEIDDLVGAVVPHPSVRRSVIVIQDDDFLASEDTVLFARGARSADSDSGPERNRIVVWQETDGDGDGDAIFGRLVDEAGNPLGDFNIQINQVVEGVQADPGVEFNARGHFAVVWQTCELPTSESTCRISSRLFDSSISPLTEEFVIGHGVSSTGSRQSCSHGYGQQFRRVRLRMASPRWNLGSFSPVRATGSPRLASRDSGHCEESRNSFHRSLNRPWYGSKTLQTREFMRGSIPVLTWLPVHLLKWPGVGESPNRPSPLLHTRASS